MSKDGLCIDWNGILIGGLISYESWVPWTTELSSLISWWRSLCYVSLIRGSNFRRYIVNRDYILVPFYRKFETNLYWNFSWSLNLERGGGGRLEFECPWNVPHLPDGYSDKGFEGDFLKWLLTVVTYMTIIWFSGIFGGIVGDSGGIVGE